MDARHTLICGAMLVCLSWPVAAQQACTSGTYVYLDVSGSMFSSSLPKVRMNGREQQAFDAMLRFVETTFLSEDVLRPGDHFQLFGFARGVEQIVEPIQSYSREADYGLLDSLFIRFDRDGDGTVSYVELGLARDFIQQTSCTALLQSAHREIGAFLDTYGRSGQVTVIVFTDGECEEADFAAELSKFTQRFEEPFRTGQLRFMIFPLRDARVAPVFEAQRIDDLYPYRVTEFFLRGTQDADVMARQAREEIRRTARTSIVFDESVDVEVEVEDEGRRFVLPLRNLSCWVDSLTRAGRYALYPPDGQPSRKRAGITKVLGSFARDTVHVHVRDTDLKEGVNRVVFELETGGADTLSHVFVVDPVIAKSTVFALLLGVVVAAVIAWIFVKPIFFSDSSSKRSRAMR